MATLRTKAKEYIPSTTKNIADLKSVNTEIDIKHKVVNKDTPKMFEYDYIEVDKTEYRVPISVIKQLKAQLAVKPSSVKFKVTKEGSGMDTEYFVTMLD
jgi:hypothetical protein